MSPSERSADSLTFWFTDIQKVALINLVLGVLTLLEPTRNLVQQLAAAISANPAGRLWVIPLEIAVCVITALIPAFYLALFRSGIALHISVRYRTLALVGALSYGFYILDSLLSQRGLAADGVA